MHAGISVVIPNYNGISLLEVTLPTVFAALDSMVGPSEVIVSDDHSTDGSIEFLQTNFPRVRVLSHNVNLGFSATSNRGIRAATYNLVLLLNSDVKLEQDYFTHQLKYFDDPKTFGVMGRIIGWDDDVIQDGAKFPSFHSAKIKTSLNYLLRDEQQMENGLFTMYVSGANALMDREKFLKLGGFNEMFSPFYVEDYELSMRAWRSGYTCWYDHQSVCRHKTSTTIKSKNKKWFIKKISNRNKWFLHSIHLNGARRTLWFIQLFPEVLVQLIAGRSYYWSALKDFLAHRKEIRKLRKNLAPSMTRSVYEVARFIETSVSQKDALFF